MSQNGIVSIGLLALIMVLNVVHVPVVHSTPITTVQLVDMDMAPANTVDMVDRLDKLATMFSDWELQYGGAKDRRGQMEVATGKGRARPTLPPGDLSEEDREVSEGCDLDHPMTCHCVYCSDCKTEEECKGLEADGSSNIGYCK